MFYELVIVCHMNMCSPGKAYGLVFDDKSVCESVMRPMQLPESMRSSNYEWICSEQNFRLGEHRGADN